MIGHDDTMEEFLLLLLPFLLVVDVDIYIS